MYSYIVAVTATAPDGASVDPATLDIDVDKLSEEPRNRCYWRLDDYKRENHKEANNTSSATADADTGSVTNEPITISLAELCEGMNGATYKMYAYVDWRNCILVRCI
jgi:hypothetical protein